MADSKVIKSTGVVVFLDLLGVKGAWRNAEDTITLWDSLVEIMNEIAAELKKAADFDMTNYSFSDTLVMTAPAEDNRVLLVLNALATVLQTMLPRSYSSGQLFRGCITTGDFYTSASKRMLIGPAIDEAVQYHALAEWLGVSLAPSAHIIVSEDAKNNKMHSSLIRYEIPLKGAAEPDGIAVNWVSSRSIKEMPQLRQFFLTQLKAASDITIAMKYRNTINFIDYVLARKNEQPPPR